MLKSSQNWGLSWDSTCLFTSDYNLNRTQFPQGGIYNPILNTNINNSYYLAMGPLTSTTNGDFIGNWYASKSASVKHDLCMHSFSFPSPYTGMIRSLAGLYSGKDLNGQPINYRGGALIKGVFNSGTFTWTSDTIIPATITSTLNNNNLWEHPRMAWGQSTPNGYIVFIGANITYSNNYNSPNKGWQPIVYATNDNGNTWSKIPGIDFTAPTMSVVLNRLDPVNTNPSLTIPFFNINEGWDITVDYNGELHIVSTILSTASNHNDSLAFTWQYQSPENYDWKHVPGKRPYIYNFVGRFGNPWSVSTIDSMSSEGCGGIVGTPGYSINPWTADPGNSNRKPVLDARLQIGSEKDVIIYYSWSESDTTNTPSNSKRNVLPNIKARACFRDWTLVPPRKSPTELNLTNPSLIISPIYTVNPNLKDKAFFHYMSPISSYLNFDGVGLDNCESQIFVPFSVSNNSYSQNSLATHWLSNSKLGFFGLRYCMNIFDREIESTDVFVYPNPAKENLSIFTLTENDSFDLSIYDLSGKLVQKNNITITNHSAKLSIDLDNGLYLLIITDATGVKSIKKIVINK
jgi:hypothetical protein